MDEWTEWKTAVSCKRKKRVSSRQIKRGANKSRFPRLLTRWSLVLCGTQWGELKRVLRAILPPQPLQIVGPAVGGNFNKTAPTAVPRIVFFEVEVFWVGTSGRMRWPLNAGARAVPELQRRTSCLVKTNKMSRAGSEFVDMCFWTLQHPVLVRTNRKWRLRGVAKAERQEGAHRVELLLNGLAWMLQRWQFYQTSVVFRHL